MPICEQWLRLLREALQQDDGSEVAHDKLITAGVGESQVLKAAYAGQADYSRRFAFLRNLHFVRWLGR